MFFFDGFLFSYHRFQWFSMVPDHWSNDAMVSMDRSGLVVKKGEQYTNFSPFFSNVLLRLDQAGGRGSPW